MLRTLIWALAIVAAYDHVVGNGTLSSAALRITSSMLRYF